MDGFMVHCRLALGWVQKRMTSQAATSHALFGSGACQLFIATCIKLLSPAENDELVNRTRCGLISKMQTPQPFAMLQRP